MKYILILSLSLLPILSWAQNETYKPSSGGMTLSNTEESLEGEYLLVTFPDKLFVCHFGKELVAANETDFTAIRHFFQQAINDSITQKISQYTTVVNTNAVSDAEREKTMVQENLGYQYENIPIDEDELSTSDKLKKKLKLKKKEPQPEKTGTYIEDGQIKSTRNTAPRYMAAQVKNPDFISLLQGIHGQQFIVTVNQVEFVYAVQTNQLDIQHERFQRQLNVHYTVLDNQGKTVTGGMATTFLSKNWNLLPEIAKHSFGEIAEQIAKEIPGLIPEETSPSE